MKLYIIVPHLSPVVFLVIIALLRPYLGKVFISQESFLHLVASYAQRCCANYGLSLHNIHTVCTKLAWSVFYHSLVVPEIDKIQTIKELLCVKCGLVSLPLLDLSLIHI